MTTPYALWFHPVAVLAISEHLRFNDICCFVHASAGAHRGSIATLTPATREQQRLINIAEKEDKEKKRKQMTWKNALEHGGRKRRSETEEDRVRKLTKFEEKRERIRIRRAAEQANLMPPSHLRPPEEMRERIRIRMAARQANLMPPSHLRPP